MKRINDELYIEGVIGSEKYASIFRNRIYGEANYNHTIVFDELINHVDGELRIHSIVYPATSANIIQNDERTEHALSKIGLISDKISNVYFVYPPSGWYHSEMVLNASNQVEEVYFDFRYFASEELNTNDELLFFDSKYLRMFMDSAFKVKDCYKFTNINLLCYSESK
jgi:hypothetical protein